MSPSVSNACARTASEGQSLCETRGAEHARAVKPRACPRRPSYDWEGEKGCLCSGVLQSTQVTAGSVEEQLTGRSSGPGSVKA